MRAQGDHICVASPGRGRTQLVFQKPDTRTTHGRSGQPRCTARPRAATCTAKRWVFQAQSLNCGRGSSEALEKLAPPKALMLLGVRWGTSSLVPLGADECNWSPCPSWEPRGCKSPPGWWLGVAPDWEHQLLALRQPAGGLNSAFDLAKFYQSQCSNQMSHVSRIFEPYPEQLSERMIRAVLFRDLCPAQNSMYGNNLCKARGQNKVAYIKMFCLFTFTICYVYIYF